MGQDQDEQEIKPAVTTTADVTTTNSNRDCALGYTNSAHNRLFRQAAWISPFTDRLIQEAAIEPEQFVLDLGSGVGDVSMLLARIKVCNLRTESPCHRRKVMLNRARARLAATKQMETRAPRAQDTHHSTDLAHTFFVVIIESVMPRRLA